MQANRLSYEYTVTDKILFTRRRAAASLGLTAAALCAPAQAQAASLDTSLPPSETPAAAIPAEQIRAAIRFHD
jgi:hypothetical protein